MPRGKNYVNNNRGVSMQASKKKKAPSMEQCFYGKGCTRADCFYRHDNEVGASGDQSKEPCMPFLAGLCTFSASGCRKRHPPKEEASRLIQKYKSIKCRYGEHCKTAGCLYVHPGDDGWDKLNQKPRIIPQLTAFPPLGGGGVKTVANGGILSVPKPMGAWKPMQPTAAVCKPVPGTGGMTPKGVAAVPPQKSAWKPAPPPATSAWGPKPSKLQQQQKPPTAAAAPASIRPSNQQQPKGRPVGATASPASGGMKNATPSSKTTTSIAPKNGNTTNAVVKPATTPMNEKAPAFTPAINGNAPALAASPTTTTPMMNGKAPVFKPAMNGNAPSPTTTVMMNGMAPSFTPKTTTSAPSMMNGMAPAFTPSPVNDGMAQPATPTTPMNGMAPAFTPTSMMTTTNDGMDAYQQPYLPDHSTNYDYGYNIDNGMIQQQQFNAYAEPMTYEYNDVPQPSPRTAARLLNINANEYVPGGGPGY